MNTASYPLPEKIYCIGNASAQSRFSMLLRASGGRFSSVSIENYPEAQPALTLFGQLPPHAVTPVLVVLEDLAMPLPEFLNQLAPFAMVAPVFVTEGNGSFDAVQSAGYPVVARMPDVNGEFLNQLIATALTIAELNLSRRELMQQWEMAENRFRDMADQFTDWLWEVDTNLRLTFSSSRKRPVQGVARGSAFSSAFLPEETMRIEDDFADLIRSPRPFHDCDYWAADAYGTRICWSVSGTPVYQPITNKLVGFRGIARDVSPMKIATDQLYYLTNHDPLTGLANRNRFADELTRTLRVAARESRTGALLLLDLDKFALINHSYGHAVGDKALVHVAQILKDHVRTTDFVARLDGDQFAVIMRDVRLEDMSPRLERLQATLSSRVLPLEQGTIALQASMGLAFYPQHAATAEDLHANALDALTAAKRQGGNQVVEYNPGSPANANAAERLQWVEFIHACLSQPDDRVLLNFQPIIPLVGDSSIEFYEVLVRLRNDDGQPVPAQNFMGVVEDFGYAPKLDRIIIHRALNLLHTWQQNSRRVRLSVNVSARTLQDEKFLSWVDQTLEGMNLKPATLVFEMTETALLVDQNRAKSFIHILHKHNAAFALDDCGVGYSSLAYLRDLDLDYIKIDGLFIRNLHNNPDDQAVVKALIDIARQKRIATIAEMVEHSAALEMLKSMEIDYGQGFYFSPPMPDVPSHG